MTRLTVILDGVGEQTSSVGRYGTELARALHASAPTGIDVVAFAAGADAAARAGVQSSLSTLDGIEFARMPRRELREAWLHSFTTTAFDGLLHGTSLLAPMRADDEEAGRQVAVTVHGLEALHRDSRTARWFRRALRRAHRRAQAVIVPTHAVADQLADLHDFGDRIRVVGAGVPAGASVPADADARATRLGLPARYVLATTDRGRAARADRLVATVASGAMPEIPVVVAGPVQWGAETLAQKAVEAGLPPSRIVPLGELDAPDRAVVVARAEAMLLVADEIGFGLGLLEALALGTPVVHPASASALELATDASLPVPLAGDASDPDRLAHALAQLVEHDAMRERLALLGHDRARAFDWSTTAAQLWRLHADL
ncbi:glycosyltransferase family 1 protein [Agrococcus versicolor]|uniref:Glycosyltransferase family 1 protein n=1 Tax=Agrococcus versicolor TaxID=501482 RepID=A0ABN3AKV1_9MICO